MVPQVKLLQQTREDLSLISSTHVKMSTMAHVCNARAEEVESSRFPELNRMELQDPQESRSHNLWQRDRA